MAAHRHRRQFLAFLIAIILPCAVLVVLVLRINAQERELGEKRRADERRALTSSLRQELTTRLDRIALQEAGARLASPEQAWSPGSGNPAVVLVATAIGLHLTLPWERDPRPRQFRRSLDRDAYARSIARGERIELVLRRPSEAIAPYEEAAALAADPAAVAYARLLRGRASLAAGLRDQAIRDYTTLLEAGFDMVDENGVPIALYAASRLLDIGLSPGSVLAALRGALSDARWLSPAALYLLRSLCDRLTSAPGVAGDEEARAMADVIAVRIASSERALALQRDFPHLGLGAGGPPGRGAESRWVPYPGPGPGPAWLVGTTALGADEDVVIAVVADSVFAAVTNAVLESGDPRAQLVVASGDDAEGEPLGAAIPDLLVRFISPDSVTDPPRDLGRWFYAATLLLVISVTLFGAYFVSRDVRRELHLADMRSRFVSAVSHELKTPLTAIRIYAETLLERTAEPTAQKEYLETIVNESERLTRLLKNILDFARIERGNRLYQRTPEDLADIVTASERAMRYTFEQHGFTLNVDIQNGLPPISVDRDAVEQAILNLLSNAMKYSGDARVVDLRLMTAGGKAVIEVTDHGFGIAVDEQERIFEQFYRTPASENDGIPGTGLGLTLVRHIAEGHGGTVAVTSSPGQGSTFAIHLPFEEGDA